MTDQRIDRLEAEIQRVTGIIKTLREQCAQANARADQAERMIKAGGLSDANHYLTQLKETQSLIEHKNKHIQTQAIEIVTLRQRIQELQSKKSSGELNEKIKAVFTEFKTS